MGPPLPCTALQDDIAAERDAVLSDLPSTCFFATFKSQQAAAIASQVGAGGRAAAAGMWGHWQGGSAGDACVSPSGARFPALC